MDKRVIFVLLFLISFVSVSADYFPKDYNVTYGGVYSQAPFGWVFSQGYLNDSDGFYYGIYPDYTPETNPTQVQLGAISYVNVSHDVSSNVIMFRPNLQNNWNNPSNAEMILEFIDSSGNVFYPAISQVTLNQPTYCAKQIDPVYDEIISIKIEQANFLNSCRFTVSEPLKNSMSQVRITFNVYDESNIATSFYFRPQLEGPFVPPAQENCAVEGDEDQDSYDNCVDPDCNGYIPGGLTPGICNQPIFASVPGYTWNETTSSWESNIEFFCSYGPDWTNLDGYCCPTGTNWYGTLCSVGAPLPVCGNNIVESGEQCDDGNTDNNDGCSFTCQTESASVCNNNNIIDLPGEYCDGSDLNGETCDLQGYDSGNLDCDNCNFDFSDCVNDDPTSPGNTNPPIVGPNEYILNGDCVEDSNPNDEYGERTWTVYNQFGQATSQSGITKCVLESEKIPFFGIYSMLVFVLVLVGFYGFRKKFK